MKFYFGVLLKFFGTFQFLLKLDKNSGYHMEAYRRFSNYLKHNSCNIYHSKKIFKQNFRQKLNIFYDNLMVFRLLSSNCSVSISWLVYLAANINSLLNRHKDYQLTDIPNTHEDFWSLLFLVMIKQSFQPEFVCLCEMFNQKVILRKSMNYFLSLSLFEVITISTM